VVNCRELADSVFGRRGRDWAGDRSVAVGCDAAWELGLVAMAFICWTEPFCLVLSWGSNEAAKIGFGVWLFGFGSGLVGLG